MVALGMLRHAVEQQSGATWQYCSGYGRVAAPGILVLVDSQHKVGIWRCFSGLGITAANGTRQFAMVLQGGAI